MSKEEMLGQPPAITRLVGAITDITENINEKFAAQVSNVVPFNKSRASSNAVLISSNHRIALEKGFGNMSLVQAVNKKNFYSPLSKQLNALWPKGMPMAFTVIGDHSKCGLTQAVRATVSSVLNRAAPVNAELAAKIEAICLNIKLSIGKKGANINNDNPLKMDLLVELEIGGRESKTFCAQTTVYLVTTADERGMENLVQIHPKTREN
jgi:hypothetical protein